MRLCKKRAGRLQVVIGPAQFRDFAPKFLDVLKVCSNGAGALAAVDFGLPDPVVKAFGTQTILGAIDSMIAHSDR